MTPEEFRTRAERALAPIEPDPLSYARLRASAGRRRSRGRAGVAAALAASAVLVTVAVGLAVRPDRGREPAVSVDVTPTASPAPVAARHGDVDGDGRVDRVTLVEDGDRAAATWRWGVEAVLTSGRTVTAWRPEGAEANESQDVAGVFDVDRDGRAEVVVRAGATASSTGYLLLTLLGTDLRWVEGADGEPFFLEIGGDPNVAMHLWGCADLDDSPGWEVFTLSNTLDGHRRAEERVVHALRHARLVELRTESGPFAGDDVGGIRCPGAGG